MRPSTCDLGYAIVDPRPAPLSATDLPSGRVARINPRYMSGFRIFFGYAELPHVFEYRGQFTHVDTGDGGEVEVRNFAQNLWPTLVSPRFSSPLSGLTARAVVRVDFDYDAADVEVVRVYRPRPCLKVIPSVGLHYFSFDQTVQADYEALVAVQGPTETIIRVRNHRKIWGVGPRFYLEAHRAVTRWAGLEARLGVAITAGQRDGHLRQGVRIVEQGQLVNEEQLRLNVEPHASLVPLFNARVGLSAHWTCRCSFVLRIACGYEFLSYINLINDPVLNSQGATISEQCVSFNLDGVYLRAEVMF